MTSEEIKIIKEQCKYWKEFKRVVIAQCEENPIKVDIELSKINDDLFPYQEFM